MNVEDVGELPVVPFGPEVGFILSIDELCGDAQSTGARLTLPSTMNQPAF